jgi:hypothetical protein
MLQLDPPQLQKKTVLHYLKNCCKELWHVEYVIVIDAMIKLNLFVSGYEVLFMSCMYLHFVGEIKISRR